MIMNLILELISTTQCTYMIDIIVCILLEINFEDNHNIDKSVNCLFIKMWVSGHDEILCTVS